VVFFCEFLSWNQHDGSFVTSRGTCFDTAGGAILNGLAAKVSAAVSEPFRRAYSQRGNADEAFDISQYT
jgi:hypothetical protein